MIKETYTWMYEPDRKKFYIWKGGIYLRYSYLLDDIDNIYSVSEEYFKKYENNLRSNDETMVQLTIDIIRNTHKKIK
jgi:hypothetical protein